MIGDAVDETVSEPAGSEETFGERRVSNKLVSKLKRAACKAADPVLCRHCCRRAARRASRLRKNSRRQAQHQC
jgi:hypothetical protein